MSSHWDDDEILSPIEPVSLPPPPSAAHPFSVVENDSFDDEEDDPVEDLTSGSFTRRLSHGAARHSPSPAAARSSPSPLPVPLIPAGGAAAAAATDPTGKISAAKQKEESTPLFTRDDETSLDIQELLADLEVLVQKIKLEAKQEGKSTTALGLGRFFMKLATGNPVSAAIDAVLTRHTALTVGERLNTLMEMQMMVANLEQFLQGRLNAGEGKVLLGTQKFVEAHREDIELLLGLGSPVEVLARLLGVEKKDLENLAREPLPPFSSGPKRKPHEATEPPGAVGEISETEVPSLRKPQAVSLDREEYQTDFLFSSTEECDWTSPVGGEDEENNVRRKETKEQARGTSGTPPGPRKVEDLVIFDQTEDDAHTHPPANRAFIEKEKKRLLQTYGVELQELYDKRVSTETIAKIFGVGKSVAAEIVESYRTPT